MSGVTIYHNPRCSKSRETLALLRDQGVEPSVVEYLTDAPDAATLEKILGMLGIEPIVVQGNQARLGRPPQKVLEIL